MTDHIAALDEMLEKWRAWLVLIPSDNSRRTLETCIANTESAIALMRGQSEMSKKVEPAPNWCPTCGRRPNDPHAAFCSNPFHLMPNDTADEQ